MNVGLAGRETKVAGVVPNAPFARLLLLIALATAGSIPWTPESANAEVVFAHAGATDPLDPAEGWTITPGDDTFVPGALNASASPLEVGGLAPDPTCAGCGLAAWVVDDRSTASGSRYRYEQTPSAAQVEDALSVGWVLRTELRVSSAEDAQSGPSDAVDPSVIVEYSEGEAGSQQRFALEFGADATGRPIVGLLGDGREFASSAEATDYLTYELVYDPVQQTAALLVDGVEVLGGYSGFAAGSVARRVNWGSGSSGGLGRGHYARVEWEIAPSLSGLDEAPELVHFEVLTPLVDTAAGAVPVRFDAEIVDTAPGVCTDLCGDYGSATHLQLVHSVTGQRYSAAFTSAGGNAYSAEVLLPAAAAGGQWEVETVWLADLAGNREVLSTSDLVGAGFAVSVSNGSGVGDTEAPALTSLARSSEFLDASVSDSTTLTLGVAESGSGLCTGDCGAEVGPSQARYLNFATGQVRDAFLAPAGPDFEATFNFSAGAATGLWILRWVRLVDNAGNRTVLTASDLAALGYDTSIVVSSSTADLSPPALVSSQATPYPIDTTNGPVTAQYIAALSDSGTGLCLAECDDFGTMTQVVYRRDGSDQVRYEPLSLVAGNANSGDFDALVDLPTSRSANVWRPQSLLLVDQAGNRRFVPEPTLTAGVAAGGIGLWSIAGRRVRRRSFSRSQPSRT